MPPALRVVVLVGAALAGVVSGLLGSFVHGLTVSGLPVGLLVALALTLAVFVLARSAAASRGGVLLAAAGWLLAVGVLSSARAEGDLVVPGSGLGYAWIAGGVLAALLVLVVPDRPPAAPAPTDPLGTGR